jgi:trigger factor
MEVFSYAMAQPFKVILTVPPEEVSARLGAFWKERGEDMMKAESGSWTKIEAFREHMEKKEGAKLYWDIIWDWVQVGTSKTDLRIENINNVNIDKLDVKTGAVISTVVNILPGVKLGDYKNIKLQEPKLTVSEQELDGQLSLALAHSPLAKKLEVSKTLEEGDMVTLSYSCKMTGTDDVVDSKTDIIASMRSGQGAALTSALIGEMAPSQVTKTIMLPENFPNEKMAGKEVDCEFDIKMVIKHEIPTPEEEAGREGMTVEQWREKFKTDIEKNKLETFELRKQDFVRSEVEKVLLGTCEVEPLPDSMIEKETNALMESLARSRNKSLEEYLKEISATQDEAFRQLAPMAMRRVMVKLIVDAIFENEKMEVNDENRALYIAKYAETADRPVEEVTKELGGADISFMVKTFMVDDLLCKSAVLVPYAEAPKPVLVEDAQPDEDVAVAAV